MISVTIGGMTLPLEKVSEKWIAQMLADGRKHGSSPCVQVSVQSPSATVVLTTPGCGGGSGGLRPPNPLEKRIFDAWQKYRLSSAHFSPNDIRDFLGALKSLV